MDRTQLEAKNINKTFERTGVAACRNVSLTLGAGEVLGIIGENGAGKSTLVHILSGSIEADSGSITKRAGTSTAIVRQHPLLLGELSAAQNIFAGREPSRFGFIRKHEMLKRIEELSGRFGIPLDPQEKASRLTLSGRMFTALLSALNTEPSVLILDEPTAVCNAPESEIVFRIIRDFRDAGGSVIFISHKLDDILRVCGRILIMQNGTVISEKKQGECSAEELSRLMFPENENPAGWAPEPGGAACPSTGGAAGPNTEETAAPAPSRGTAGVSIGRSMKSGASGNSAGAPPSAPGPAAAPIFALHGISTAGPEGRGLHDLSFTVESGEILGLTGLKESGLDLLEDVICGLRSPADGSFSFLGKSYGGSGFPRARRKGLRIVPSDRGKRGSAPEARVWENLIITGRRTFQKHLLLDRGKIARHSRMLIKRNKIAADTENTAEQLSGGTLQKLIIYRELDGIVPFLCVAEPSNGLDTRSRELLHRRIFDLARDGGGILIISSDMDEILKICTRIAVLYQGRITAIKDARDFSRKELGRAIIGRTDEAGRGHTASGGTEGGKQESGDEGSRQSDGGEPTSDRKEESKC